MPRAPQADKRRRWRDCDRLELADHGVMLRRPPRQSKPRPLPGRSRDWCPSNSIAWTADSARQEPDHWAPIEPSVFYPCEDKVAPDFVAHMSISLSAMDLNPDSSSPSQSIYRINQACERCRHKRVRCSGHAPCIRCQKDREECTYGHPRARRKSTLTAIDEHNNARQDASQLQRLVVATGDASTSPYVSSSKSDTPGQMLSPWDPSSIHTSTRSQSTEAGFDEQENDDDVGIQTDSSVSSVLDASPQDTEPKRRPSARARARKTRISSACLECKKRRRKCTGETPCQTCTLFQTDCIYDRSQDRRSKAYLQKQLVDAMESDNEQESMPMVPRNADLDLDPDPDLATNLQKSLQLAEKSHSVTDTSRRATDSRRLICSAFCELSITRSKRAGWYPADLREQQEVLLQGPEHLVTPLVLPDDSPMSMMFTNFKSAVDTMLQRGTPLDEVLGPLDPIVDLLFRPRQSTDPFSACTWACEVARIHHVQIDIFTQLANAFLLTRFMRWIIAPNLENYLLLPDLMRPTAAQTRIPHYASADLYPLPAVRDALVKGELRLIETIGIDGPPGIKFNWPFDLEKAVDRDPVTDFITTSRLFGLCAAEARNWTCSKDFLTNTVMSSGAINLIDHQHSWAEDEEM